MKDDTISRQAAIDALWKALYEYEDKTEKQFQESEDLDVGDWIEHRIFVQNMNDIDRQTILNLPSAQPEIIRCEDCKHYEADIMGNPWGVCCHKDCVIDNCGSLVDEKGWCYRAKRRTDG